MGSNVVSGGFGDVYNGNLKETVKFFWTQRRRIAIKKLRMGGNRDMRLRVAVVCAQGRCIGRQ